VKAEASGRAHRENRNFLTNELQNIMSTATINILSLSFLHQTKKEGDITACRTMRNLRAKNIQEVAQSFPEEFHPIYRRKRFPSVNHSEF